MFKFIILNSIKMSVYFKLSYHNPEDSFGQLELYLDEDGVTPLHTAVLSNQIHLVESEIICLKKRKFSLNSQTKSGQTSLLLACKLCADSNIAKLLIEEGANVNISDNMQITPLHAACLTQKVDVAEILVRAGASVNSQDTSQDAKKRPHNTPLHYAVFARNANLIELLLDAGADANIKNGYWSGETSLQYVCAWRECNLYKSTVERLVSLTTDLNGFNKYRHSTLAQAIFYSNNLLASLLIKYGVDVNLFVSMAFKLPIVEALIKRNAVIFKMIWNVVNIEICNKERYFYDYLIEWAWNPNKPDLVECFYEVMNTPGVVLHPEGWHFYSLAILFTDPRFEDREIVEELFKNKTEDVLGITKKLFEKGAIFRELDLQGLIYLCQKYHMYNYSDSEIKLLNLFVDNNVDITPYIIYFSIVNYPEFTLKLLQYCIMCDPEDIFKHFLKIKRLIDVSILTLIKNVLKLYSPRKKLRFKLLLHVRKFSEPRNYPVKRRYNNTNLNDLEFPFHTCVLGSQIDYELCEEVLDFLLVDRVPSLVELSRNKIRKQLRTHCKDTFSYLKNLRLLQVPKRYADIIQCKANVNVL